MPVKIAVIGAGSIGFTRRLLQDILTVPELQDTEFAFTDISQSNLEMVSELCRRDIIGNGLPATITSSLDRRATVADADYIFCLIRQGGLEAFQTDIDIPLQYGIDQCVGDTICAGGIFYAQRTIPVLLDFCKDIREAAKPGALFLNYSNPMAMNTWACNEIGKVNTVGLCHGVQGAHQQIVECTEVWAKKQKLLDPDVTLTRRDVDATFAGINHQTWCVQARWGKIDMIPHMLEAFEGHPRWSRIEKVRIDVLRRFGYYSTESNGHLSEYLPWYRKRTHEIEKWIDLDCWIHGETGGYLRVCTEGRNWFETDYPNWLKAEPPKFTAETRSEEHASWIIEALETGRVYRGHFNVMNRGHIPNLPEGCCIEIPGYVDRHGIQMVHVGDLPVGCAATCAASIRVQEMGVKAALTGDVELLKLALLHDPLTAAVCSTEEVWQLTDEMLVAQEKWLPQFANGIPMARQRLEIAERMGTRVKLRATEGAARLKVKSVEEMNDHREAANRNAAAADKGNLLKKAV